MAQTNSQIQSNQIQFFEISEQLKDELERILQPITDPNFLNLMIAPRNTVVPILQMLKMAPYKISTEFIKYYDPDNGLIFFVSNDLEGGATEKRREAIIKISRGEFALFFRTRGSKKIYKYKFDSYEIERIFPNNLEFYSEIGGSTVYFDFGNDYEIVKYGFGVRLEFKKYIKIDNLVLVKLEKAEKIDLWLDKEVEINGLNVRKIINLDGVYYLEKGDEKYLVIDLNRIPLDSLDRNE